jgi:hypothetical protein
VVRCIEKYDPILKIVKKKDEEAAGLSEFS